MKNQVYPHFIPSKRRFPLKKIMKNSVSHLQKFYPGANYHEANSSFFCSVVTQLLRSGSEALPGIA